MNQRIPPSLALYPPYSPNPDMQSLYNQVKRRSVQAWRLSSFIAKIYAALHR